jgi:hypothetical protein
LGPLIGIFAVWSVALWLPAVQIGSGTSLRGFEVFVRGWQAFDLGVFSWAANPLFLTAVALCAWRCHRVAGVLAGVGCVLALTSFGAARLAASTGTSLPPVMLQAGFYAWLASQFALLAWCGICAVRTGIPARPKNIPHPSPFRD